MEGFNIGQYIDRDVWRNPEFKAWFDSRPANVQKVIVAYPPGKTYRMMGTHGNFHIALYEIIAYEVCEDESITVRVFTNGVCNGLTAREVFGVDPATLVPVEKEAIN